jgi:hypothetical protein
MEKSAHGWPGKYTMCFAENAERNPWEPLHVELGFAPETSIVVVVAARGVITVVKSSHEGASGTSKPSSARCAAKGSRAITARRAGERAARVAPIGR